MGKPIIEREILKLRRGKGVGQPWHFLDFKKGMGYAVEDSGNYENLRNLNREKHTLKSPDILAIKGLGQFKKIKIVSDFNKMIENWQVSDFHIGNPRNNVDVGLAEHLSVTGDNLSLVAKFIYENQPEVSQTI